MGLLTFLGPKFCADHENHGRFPETSSVFALFWKSGIPDFDQVVPSLKRPCRPRFLRCVWYLNEIHTKTSYFWCMSRIAYQNTKLTELSAPEHKFMNQNLLIFSFFSSLKCIFGLKYRSPHRFWYMYIKTTQIKVRK